MNCKHTASRNLFFNAPGDIALTLILYLSHSSLNFLTNPLIEYSIISMAPGCGFWPFIEHDNRNTMVPDEAFRYFSPSETKENGCLKFASNKSSHTCCGQFVRYLTLEPKSGATYTNISMPPQSFSTFKCIILLRP